MPGASKGRKRKTRAASNSESSQDSQAQVCKPECKYVPRFGTNKRAKLVLKKKSGNSNNLNQDIPLTQPTPNTLAYSEDASQTQSISLTQIPVPLTQLAHVPIYHTLSNEMSDCDDIASEAESELAPDKHFPATQPVHSANEETNSAIPATQPVHSANEETNSAIPATQPVCVTDKKINNSTAHVSANQLGYTVESISEMTDEKTALDEHILSAIPAQNTNKELNVLTTEPDGGKRDCSSTSEKEHTPQKEETIPGFTLSQVASQLNTTTTDLNDTDTEKLVEQKNHNKIDALIQQEDTLGIVDNDVEKEIREAEVVQVHVPAHAPIEALAEVDSRNLSLLNPFSDDNEFEEAEEDSVSNDNTTAVEDQMSGGDIQNEHPLGLCNEESQQSHVGIMHDPIENATLPSTQISPVVPHEKAQGTSPPMKQSNHDQLDQPSQEEIKAVQEMMDLTAADLMESQLAVAGMSPPPMRTLERDSDWDTLEGSKMLRGLIEELSTMNQFLVRCKRELECARRQRNTWIKSQGQRKV